MERGLNSENETEVVKTEEKGREIDNIPRCCVTRRGENG